MASSSRFPGVYFIPRLTTNIISTKQLDKGSYKTKIEGGLMRIRKPGGQLHLKVV